MLKWTASAQKLTQVTSSAVATRAGSMHTMQRIATKRRQRRATMDNQLSITNNKNKENILPPACTSTPMTAMAMMSSPSNDHHGSSPLTDILNTTPTAGASPLLVGTTTPQRRRVSSTSVTLVNLRASSTSSSLSPSTSTLSSISRCCRRPASIANMQMLPSSQQQQYATTLPRYEEEEYSPNMAMPSGQQLALRGLIPDPFLGNPRYIVTHELITKEQNQRQRQQDKEPPAAMLNRSLPRKRKLEQEFIEIANEAEKCSRNQTVVSSTKMGDQTLDKLIDAILDSARKDEKKKKRRKSFNLRRRTLVKNQIETNNNNRSNNNGLILSPSYAPGDDPASDLSFLFVERPCSSKNKVKGKLLPSPNTGEGGSVSLAKCAVATPAPMTPIPGARRIPDAVLQQLPTPLPAKFPSSLASNIPVDDDHDHDDGDDNDASNTFCLDTTPPPPPPSSSIVPSLRSLAQKRRCHHAHHKDKSSMTKKFKSDSSDYLEVGLALPSSIYV